MEQEVLVRLITQKICEILAEKTPGFGGIPVGVSNRHVHLTPEAIHTLFGAGAILTPFKFLAQPGEFAAAETVTLVGPKGVIPRVRILGPARRFNQVEISRTDGFLLGITPPVRDSGDLAGSPGITLVGPRGAVTLAEGVIAAARHVHLHPKEAAQLGVRDGDRIDLEAGTERCVVFRHILARVSSRYRKELHLDTDEANAAGLKTGDLAWPVSCRGGDSAHG